MDNKSLIDDNMMKLVLCNHGLILGYNLRDLHSDPFAMAMNIADNDELKLIFYIKPEYTIFLRMDKASPHQPIILNITGFIFPNSRYTAEEGLISCKK